jgi:hypothetical protein
VFLEDFIGRDPDSWAQFARDFPVVVSEEYSPTSIATSTLIPINKESMWDLLIHNSNSIPTI